MVSFNSVLFISEFLGATVSAASYHGANTDRVLRAATKRSNIFRRSMRVEKKFNAELSFVEAENGWGSNEIFASKVTLGSEAPILNLEDVEHHLDDVKCADGKMKLRFVDAVSARDARHACHGGMVITSHDSCNAEGERSVYKVTSVDYPEDEFSLDLAVIEASWKESFSTFSIEFGHTTDSHLFRRHSDFSKVHQRRQEPSITAPAVEIPSGIPEDKVTAEFDLKQELIDKTFAPEDFTAGIENIVAIPDLPVEVGCNNCSTFGRLTISQGAISIDMSQVDLIPDVLQGGDDGKDLFNVITGGFFELTATNVGAHVDLFARPKVSGEFEIALPGLPIAGFIIPGIGSAGVTFESSIKASYEVSGGLEVGYGFDVALPSESNIKVELTNFENSQVVGFPDATLQPLPFTANVTDVEILLGLAFVPSIPIGFKFLDQLKASVNVNMDLPRLDAKLTTKLNAGPDCNDLPSNGTQPASGNSTENNSVSTNPPSFQLADALAELGPLVLVEANISLSINVGAGFDFPLLPPPANKIATQANIFATTFTLGTTCLAAGKGFSTATDVWNSMTSSLGLTDVLPIHTPTPSATAHEQQGCDKTTSCSCVKATTTVYVEAPPEHEITKTSVVEHSTTDIPPPPATNLPPPVVPPVESSYSVPGNTTSLQSGTGTSTPPVPTAPQEFPGAAPGLFAPIFSWGWQAAMLGVSSVAGAMIML